MIDDTYIIEPKPPRRMRRPSCAGPWRNPRCWRSKSNGCASRRRSKSFTWRLRRSPRRLLMDISSCRIT